MFLIQNDGHGNHGWPKNVDMVLKLFIFNCHACNTKWTILAKLAISSPTIEPVTTYSPQQQLCGGKNGFNLPQHPNSEGELQFRHPPLPNSEGRSPHSKIIILSPAVLHRITTLFWQRNA